MPRRLVFIMIIAAIAGTIAAVSSFRTQTAVQGATRADVERAVTQSEQNYDAVACLVRLNLLIIEVQTRPLADRQPLTQAEFNAMCPPSLFRPPPDGTATVTTTTSSTIPATTTTATGPVVPGRRTSTTRAAPARPGPTPGATTPTSTPATTRPPAPTTTVAPCPQPTVPPSVPGLPTCPPRPLR